MDKRIDKTLTRVREAALDFLAEHGFAAFTMDAIAKHSGTAKSTLYRHWPDRIALISDALETLNHQPLQARSLSSGELRSRIIELLTHLASVFENSQIGKAMPALIEAAEHHPQVAKFLHEYSATRRQTLLDLLSAGKELGDLSPDFDPEIAALALSGPIFYCRLMSSTVFSPDKVPELVDFILGQQR
jgi:AcrR family transcriptional regulator